ncbi:PepSY-associated TM helix domain-containing protein [Bacteroides fluxus]|uniref:PepSY-associated TM helix domain-containing protein n=1 Tax=Bacteroides fluxus TaxID=626930 RepID=UPI0023A8C28D|nr:PepSY-associated TM helix domain-containing protein [Bacteroides fluxus]
MNVITQLMYSIHRILGTLLCILFLMWFLSAFVMMYHRFPHVNAKEKLQKQEVLSASGDSLPDIAAVIARLPHKEQVRKLTLNRKFGQTFFHVRTGKGEYNLPLNPSDSLLPTDSKYIHRIAALWCPAPIVHIDTVNSPDQWIPFGELKKEMPIYKIYFADDAGTQLYLSSRNGEALQFSNRNERFWAWLGAIPHWVYFTWLRQDTALWNKTVIWLSGMGCVMVIAGIWVTIDVWRKTRRNRYHRFSPYRKKWYHWHYLTGIFFGIFVLTFTFSGMMSVADIPEWIHKPALKTNPIRTLHAHAPRPEHYTLDYRRIIAAYPQALQIEWSNFREHPYYTVKDGKTEFYIDATDSLPRPLHLSEDEIRRGIESIYASDSTGANAPIPIRMSLLGHFETYYRDMSNMYRERPQLPVWKTVVEDADRSIYYIHPETGIIRHVDTSSRWKYWSYTALHRMRLPGLNSNAALRKTVLWILLLGGSAVSVTGVALSINYLRRKCRRKRKSERYIQR